MAIGTATAILAAGALGAGGAVLAGSRGARAATDAAQLQVTAANRAADIQQQMFNTTREDLAPFRTAGAGAIPALNRLIPGSENEDPLIDQLRQLLPGGNNPLVKALGSFVPGSANPAGSAVMARNLLGLSADGSAMPTGASTAAIQRALESTPGYQFTRDQGLKSVQNSYAAKGLGQSGAAMRGAADYVTGLANSTYEQRLQDYIGFYNNEFTNTFNAYGRTFDNTYNALGQRANTLQNIVNTGANAAAQTGTIGSTYAGTIGNTLTSGAAAGAGGIVGASNAGTNAITGVTGALGQSLLLNAFMGQNATPPTVTGMYSAGRNALTPAQLAGG